MDGSQHREDKIMTISTNNISADISVTGQKLEEVASFKYLGATLCMDGTCSAVVFIRIASAMVAMARLSRIWRCNTISFASKFKLCKSLAISVAVKHGSCLLTLEKNIQAFEAKCL